MTEPLALGQPGLRCEHLDSMLDPLFPLNDRYGANFSPFSQILETRVLALDQSLDTYLMGELSQSPHFNGSALELAMKWARAARWAASGGNAQPWEITISEGARSNEIQVTLQIDPVYKKHPSPMDVGGKASVIALGCYAVYLESLAHKDGYHLVSTDHQNPNSSWDIRVALVFSHREYCLGPTTNRHPDEASLYGRWTDRMPFKTSRCPEELKMRLAEIWRHHTTITEYVFAENRDQLIAPLRRLEQLRWENPIFRDALFEEISFSSLTSSESERKIPSAQLGASVTERYFLHALYRYPSLRNLLDFGGAKVIARKTVGKLIRNSSEVIWLQTKDDTDAGCYELGRCFQKLWLEINQYGFSFQPIGLPLVALSFWHGDNHQIAKNSRHAKAVLEVTEIFRTEFSIDLKKPALGFRFGPTRFSQTAASRKSPRAEPRVFQREQR